MFADLLRQRLRGIVEVSPEVADRLFAHYELLVRWNKSLNLTSIESLETAVERHYCESAFLALHLPPDQGLKICDVGSGAGFPGIPVAVFRPDCSVVLIESHQRKAVFLREATRGMPNVRILAKRAEEVAEKFDRLISRAVSYADLVKPARKLAGAANLLTGEEAPPEALGFQWDSPIALPWGKKRFLRTGTIVSRETEHE